MPSGKKRKGHKETQQVDLELIKIFWIIQSMN